MRPRPTVALMVAGAAVLTACSPAVDEPAPATTTAPVAAAPGTSPPAPIPGSTSPAAVATTTAAPKVTTAALATLPLATTAAPTVPGVRTRPWWLGTRPLPLRPDGIGVAQPTPPELDPRVLATLDVLPAPPGDVFTWSVGPVPADVVARSTWQPACPVALGDLRYVTVSFVGFDGLAHTGELLVHADAAAALVEVFRRLFEARFPIEEMRVTRADELDAAATGDSNNTGAFVCRPAVGSTTWSQHAFGRAVDVNPFQNPYTKRDIVIPELATAYVVREPARPGMILPGGTVVEAFAAVGWEWGGNFRSSTDLHHFSANGR